MMRMVKKNAFLMKIANLKIVVHVPMMILSIVKHVFQDFLHFWEDAINADSHVLNAFSLQQPFLPLQSTQLLALILDLFKQH